MVNPRMRFDGIDIDQLRHIQEELARLRDDLNEESGAYRELDIAIDRIESAIETGSKTAGMDGVFIDAEDFLPKDDSEKE